MRQTLHQLEGMHAESVYPVCQPPSSPFTSLSSVPGRGVRLPPRLPARHEPRALARAAREDRRGTHEPCTDADAPLQITRLRTPCLAPCAPVRDGQAIGVHHVRTSGADLVSGAGRARARARRGREAWFEAVGTLPLRCCVRIAQHGGRRPLSAPALPPPGPQRALERAKQARRNAALAAWSRPAAPPATALAPASGSGRAAVSATAGSGRAASLAVAAAGLLRRGVLPALWAVEDNARGALVLAVFGFKASDGLAVMPDLESCQRRPTERPEQPRFTPCAVSAPASLPGMPSASRSPARQLVAVGPLPQALEWWYASGEEALAKGAALPPAPPPPPPAPAPPPLGVGLPADITTCPVCL
jgi:hypothetical protein